MAVVTHLEGLADDRPQVDSAGRFEDTAEHRPEDTLDPLQTVDDLGSEGSIAEHDALDSFGVQGRLLVGRHGFDDFAMSRRRVQVERITLYPYPLSRLLSECDRLRNHASDPNLLRRLHQDRGGLVTQSVGQLGALRGGTQVEQALRQ